MDSNHKIIQQIAAQGMLPLFYHDDKQVCIEVVRAMYAGGVRIVEFTNRGPNAMENFKALVAEKKNNLPELVLAVGTIKTGEQATRFINAGADFLISPVFDADVCDVAYLSKVLWIPGCMTPTEIHVAVNAGCSLVKLFPGNVLGPAFVSGVKELFPNVQLMPTGGVDLNKENLSAWFHAGVMAVGMGSKLLTKAILEAKEYEKITELTKEALAIIKDIRE